MTKPTGRPRGRPKTKEYVTIMARVPQDLAERVQRYAGRKRQTISDVLRDGLLVLLEEDDSYRPFLSDRDAAPYILSDTKEEGEESQSPFMSDNNDSPTPILSDIKEDSAPDNAAKTVISPHNKGAEEILSDINKDATIVSDTKEDETDIVSDTIPPFDAAKFVLGRLCPRGHEYHGTGRTLLKRTNRHCPACDREKWHERKQARRAQ